MANASADDGPAAGHEGEGQPTVDFGWESEKPLDGRRAKAAKAKKRKLKPGSFGAP